MEHEVVVPMPAELVRQALQDPALLARCVPGLSTEPAAVGSGPAEEIGGRLKLRIGASTITYRGVLSLIEGREGVLTVFAEGQEARGTGEATATLRVSVADGAAEGTAVVRFTGDLSATGRLTEFDEETLATTGRRLLDRFVASLASPNADADVDLDGDPEPEETEEPAEAGAETGAETASNAAAEAAEAPADEVAAEVADDTEDAPEDDTKDATGDSEDADDVEEPGATVVFLEDRQDEPGDDLDDDLSDLIAFSDADAERFGLPTGDRSDRDEDAADSPAAEAEEQIPAELPFEYEQEPVLSGPVRRSIVGRSAEEVDHAPPRGRYAPPCRPAAPVPARRPAGAARPVASWCRARAAAAPCRG